MLYISPWAGFEPITSVVIGTDCIGSCKSNYHTITPTTAPVQRGIELYITNLVMTRNFKTVMVNNYTNVNTTNNHLWPQIFERKKDQYLWRWRFRFCFIFFCLFFIFIFIYFFFFALGKREVVRMKVKRRVKFYIKMSYEKKQRSVVINFTNNKTNNHLPSQILEHYKTTTYDCGNPSLGINFTIVL